MLPAARRYRFPTGELRHAYDLARQAVALLIGVISVFAFATGSRDKPRSPTRSRVAFLMRQRPPFSNILVEAMRQGAEQTPRSTNSLDVMLPCYLTSATSTSPTITSGIPRANSTTLCLTQSAAFVLDTSAASALSNILTVITTSSPPSAK